MFARCLKALLEFVSAIKLDLVFDLNELHGRNCQLNSSCHPNCTCTGPWDSSNAKELLQWFHSDYSERDSKVYGFELGNELTRSHHITMEENVEDVQHLGKMVNAVWPPTARQPRRFLVAPSTDACDETAWQFIHGTANTLGAFSYHSYPAQDCRNYNAQMLNATWLRTGLIQRDAHANSTGCIQAWQARSAAHKALQLWLTETNACYSLPMNKSSGKPIDNPSGVGFMGSFLNGFWYVASLGQYAESGVTMHGRWSLIGGSGFGIVNAVWTGPHGKSLEWVASPDFWVAVLHKKLIGQARVLSSTSEVRSSLSNSAAIPLVYTYCKQTSLVVMYAHPGGQPATIRVGAGMAARDAWVLTAPGGDLNATAPCLNGREVPLKLGPKGDLPNMDSVRVTGNAADQWSVPAFSLGFATFSGSGAAEACA